MRVSGHPCMGVVHHLLSDHTAREGMKGAQATIWQWDQGLFVFFFLKYCGCIYVGKSIPVDTQPLRDIYCEGTKLTTWQCLTVNCHNSSRNGR